MWTAGHRKEKYEAGRWPAAHRCGEEPRALPWAGMTQAFGLALQVFRVSALNGPFPFPPSLYFVFVPVQSWLGLINCRTPRRGIAPHHPLPPAWPRSEQSPPVTIFRIAGAADAG